MEFYTSDWDEYWREKNKRYDRYSSLVSEPLSENEGALSARAKELDRLNLEIDQVHFMTKWHPIETVPGSGRVLVCGDGESGEIDVRYIQPELHKWWMPMPKGSRTK